MNAARRNDGNDARPGPVVMPVRGGLPTLVLPGRPAGYTLTDLQNAGAVVPLPQGEPAVSGAMRAPQ